MNIRIILAFVLLLVSSSMVTAVTIYTNEVNFIGDLDIPYSNLNFDNLVSGSTIANGESVDGITFQYNFGGTELMISNVYDSVSVPNFLGTTDSSVLQDGDDFQLSFDPINAIGLHIITADTMFDDDIFLTIGDVSIGLLSANIQQTLSDGSNVFFLGLIDYETAFTSADLTTIGGGFFTYNIDDIVTAKSIPIPAVSLLMATGLMLLSVARKVF